MTEVVAPPNLNTLPPIEHVLEELKGEEPVGVDALGKEVGEEGREEQMEGVKVRSSFSFFVYFQMDLSSLF